MERKREVIINDLKESINSLDQNFKTMFKNDIKNISYGDLLESTFQLIHKFLCQNRFVIFSYISGIL